MARPTLSKNVVISAANVFAVVGASLVAVPLLVDRLGLAGYGVWSLAQALVIYVTSAELGFGPAVARFTSIHRDDPLTARQIMWAAIGLYLAVGLLLAFVLSALAGPITDLFDIPASLRADAEATIGLTGPISAVALLAGVLGHVLTGLERFATFTLTNAAGSVVFLLVLGVGLSEGARLQDAAYAALAQWSVVGVLRLAILVPLLRGRGRMLPRRALLRELFGYSARLQAATFATLLNTQTDRIVVGLVAPAATLGQVSIAVQVAEAGRFLAYAVATPMMSRMAVLFGSEGRNALAAEYRRVRGVWLAGVTVVVAAGAGSTGTVIAGWIGEGHSQAAIYASLLLVGYGVGVLPNSEFALLRAIGRPHLEGMFGVVTVALNLTATIAFGVLFGATGVVVATTVAYLCSTGWVTGRVTAELPPETRRAGAGAVRLVLVGVGTAGVALILGIALDTVLGNVAALLVFAPLMLAVMALAYGIAHRGPHL